MGRFSLSISQLRWLLLVNLQEENSRNLRIVMRYETLQSSIQMALTFLWFWEFQFEKKLICNFLINDSWIYEKP